MPRRTLSPCMATIVIVMSLPMMMLSLVFLESTSIIRFFLGVVCSLIHIVDAESFYFATIGEG